MTEIVPPPSDTSTTTIEPVTTLPTIETARRAGVLLVLFIFVALLYYDLLHLLASIFKVPLPF